MIPTGSSLDNDTGTANTFIWKIICRCQALLSMLLGVDLREDIMTNLPLLVQCVHIQYIQRQPINRTSSLEFSSVSHYHNVFYMSYFMFERQDKIPDKSTLGRNGLVQLTHLGVQPTMLGKGWRQLVTWYLQPRSRERWMHLNLACPPPPSGQCRISGHGMVPPTVKVGFSL